MAFRAEQVEAISRCLLAMHEGAERRGHRGAQRFSLDELAKVVPFDGAVVGTGTVHEGRSRTHDAFLHGLPPEFMTSWEEVSEEDLLIVEAMRKPGTSVVYDGRTMRGYGDHAGHHARKWGIHHVLGHAQTYEGSGLYWVIGIARRDPQMPFRSTELRTVDIIAPHLLAVHRRARLDELRRADGAHEPEDFARALVNHRGLLLEASGTFPDLLKRAFPSWAGPWLPAEARRALGHEASFVPKSGRIKLHFQPCDDGFLVHVRPLLPADALSARERVVALAFAKGDTARQVAAQLGLAPNTVRRHLANVYDKLGISSKTEIANMLTDR